MGSIPDQGAMDLFMESILAGDRPGGSQVVKRLINQNIPVQRIYEELIKKALYTVGELWEQNRITVAEEHLATSVSEAIMNELFPSLVARKRAGRNVLLACVENELHQVGVKMVADLFEMSGWDSHFLGSNVPVSEVLAYAHKTQPELFALSASIYFHLPVLERMLREIQSQFPHTPLMIGGQAFRHGGKELFEHDRGVVWIPDLYALESYLEHFDKTASNPKSTH
ncbi:MAG: cobalamin-dependent protein [Bacteroidales bacterium]